MAQEEGFNRKLQHLEKEKKKLEDRIKSENDRGKNYEAMLRKVNEEREEERRQTMMDQDNMMRNLQKMQKEREDLTRILQ